MGLVPALRLAESVGRYDLLDEHLSVDSPNPVTKARGVVGRMLAGADSIDDQDLLRHGGMPRRFDGVPAPSTLATFLRSFTHGHLQKLDRIGGEVLAGLAAQVPGVTPGADTTSRSRSSMSMTPVSEVHWHAKQGVAYGYSSAHVMRLARYQASWAPTSTARGSLDLLPAHRF